MLKELRRIQHVLHLSTWNTNAHIITKSGTSGVSAKRVKGTHHVRVVLVYTHVREGIETSHRSKSQMTVKLREGVVRVLAGLHLGQRLRSGSGC